ncbi:hypothetical protein HPP92_001404 [Vanilla planifolia]|uniref:MATH domain-containing protein n=1 Tax=Vanilla planifolia TaxID=51239 RepID=A0A835S3C0_VANPL|nr:hypothetical protein HPP92_001404 [Vanilla planifolia]
MWVSRLFSGRGGKEQHFDPKSFMPSSSPVPYKGAGKSKKGESSGIIEDLSVKDASTYDFLWTIKSLSKLATSNEKYVSGRFEAKGITWKLVFYPNGNIVNGQVSLYLMLSKAASYPAKTEFKVSYELFLFDQNTGSTLSHKGDNVLQAQDKIGLRGFVDNKTFKDSSKGYVVKDSCMFGVKIFHVVPIQTATECLHPVEKIKHEYTWKIENFSKLDKKTSHEKKFTGGDYIWSIFVYPEGDLKSDEENKGEYLSLFLQYHGTVLDTPASKVSAEFNLSIIDQIGGNHKKINSTEVFKCCNPGWGWSFISLDEFYDPKHGFIVNDTCIIEAKVAVLAVVK